MSSIVEYLLKSFLSDLKTLFNKDKYVYTLERQLKQKQAEEKLEKLYNDIEKISLGEILRKIHEIYNINQSIPVISTFYSNPQTSVFTEILEYIANHRELNSHYAQALVEMIDWEGVRIGYEVYSILHAVQVCPSQPSMVTLEQMLIQIKKELLKNNLDDQRFDDLVTTKNQIEDILYDLE